MKKIYYLFASLTLGLFVASCQNGLEEMIDESEVQNELATTRAEENDSDDEEMPLRYPIGPAISGPTIITGTSNKTFSVIPPNESDTTIWSYNTSYFNYGADNNTTLMISLKNANLAADATITATFRDTINNIVLSQSRFYTGINGPHYNHCSVRVVRSSDGAEVYPSHNVYLEPNTYYYAYFSTTTGGSNMSLTWTFYEDEVEIINQYSYTLYFKTGDIDNCFMHIDGKLAGSSITKALLGVSLY